MTAAYCTREDVKDALDVAVTARADAQIDRHILGVSAGVEGLMNRQFWPLKATKYWDWPNYQYAAPWRLWLDRNELISVTSVTTGGAALAPTAYFLRPENTGPPYSHVEIYLSSGAAFGAGSNAPQQSIGIAGTFGGCADTAAAGTLAASVSSTSATTITVTNSAAVGTLDTVLVDTEYMTVTGKSSLTTGQTLQTPIAASVADVTLAVTTGSAFGVGETLLLDAERMRIVDIAGNNLVVKRAWDGSVLAAHTGSTIYAPRTLTVTRGVWGTTAATHSNAAPVARHAPPPLIRNLTVATVTLAMLEDSQAWTETKGDGGKSGVMGRLNDLREQASIQHARQARTRAI